MLCIYQAIMLEKATYICNESEPKVVEILLHVLGHKFHRYHLLIFGGIQDHQMIRFFEQVQ